MSRQPPQQQPPPAQKLQLRYQKVGRARFASHRDFGRAFERALRRAEIPMAYSSGFSPHPRISYANAAPTGAASNAEYLEIGLSAWREPAWVLDALNRELPEGLQLAAIRETPATKLADELQGSEWEMSVLGVPDLAGSVARFLAATDVQVERMTKNGVRVFDARPAILGLEASGENRLLAVIVHQVPLVRPDDLISGLTRVDATFRPIQPVLIHRLKQGLIVDDDIVNVF